MTTINSMQDFSRLLREHPDWRDEVRRLLLTDELLELPQRFAEYAEATDKRMDSIEKRLGELVEHGRETDRRLGELVEHGRETDRRLDSLAAQAKIANRRLDALERDMGELKGVALQLRLQHVGAGRIATMFKLRNTRALRMAESNRNSVEFENALADAEDAGIITEADYDRLMVTDLIVRGTIRGASTTIYAPIEATYTIHRGDIMKVNHSVAALRKVFPDADVRGALYYMDAADYIEYEAQDEGIGLVKENRLR